MADIPTLQELEGCTPLITPAGRKLLAELYGHPHAPRWNQKTGDRLTAADLERVAGFARSLAQGDRSRTAAPHPPAPLLEQLAAQRPGCGWLRQSLPDHGDWVGLWQSLPTLTREEIATRPDNLIPEDADWQPMVVYRTSGSTGHAILIPHHPAAVACYQPLISFALARYGLDGVFSDRETACFLVGAQRHTVTYPTVLAAWGGAGFAKINLQQTEWPEEESPHRYFETFAPRILTGDPLSFAEMMHRGIAVQPAALVTTSVALGAALKERLESFFQAPVIDWYSLTETGPMGYGCPRGDGYHLLPHDLYVEALDEQGHQVAAGQRGEITVTGGRNPYLPLLRYRTGDWGAIDHTPCPCGDPAPRLTELEGRKPVLLYAADGRVVNPLEISRILRQYPLVQHEFFQRSDRSCTLRLRPIPGSGEGFAVAALHQELAQLLGALPLKVELDPQLGSRPGDGKVVPYRSAHRLEE